MLDLGLILKTSPDQEQLLNPSGDYLGCTGYRMLFGWILIKTSCSAIWYPADPNSGCLVSGSSKWETGYPVTATPNIKIRFFENLYSGLFHNRIFSYYRISRSVFVKTGYLVSGLKINMRYNPSCMMKCQLTLNLLSGVPETAGRDYARA